jgi:Zn-dependent protease with chaperone function
VTGERVAFFEEQARNRRATWRLAVASASSVVLIGIPVSLVITPLIYGLILIVVEVVHLVHPLPAAMTQQIGALIDAFQAALDTRRGTVAPVSALQLVAIGAVALAPGVIVMLGLWSAVRAVVNRSGVGTLLLALGARPVRRDDLEETQLQNVAEEMAIAAGLPPPRVMLIDTRAANAGLCGPRHGEATLVVSRGLLDGFSREETQAIVAHLVGSAGNGDLRIAADLASLFQTLGLLTALLDAPIGATSFARLRDVVRASLRRTENAAEDDRMGALLAGRLSLQGKAGEAPRDDDHPGWRTPLILASQSVKWTLFLGTSLIVGPTLALLWRARRYLADATAVQLTRNPEALWQALIHLGRSGGGLEGGDPASYLFIVGPESVEWAGRGDKMGTNSLVTFHPRLDRRLRRIERQGATSRIAAAATQPWPHRIAKAAGTAAIGVVFGIGLLAGGAGMALFVGISVVVDVLALEAVHGVFSLLGAIKAATLG